MTNEQLALLLTEIHQSLVGVCDRIDSHLDESGANRHKKRGEWIGNPNDGPKKTDFYFYSGPENWNWIDDSSGEFVCLDEFKEYLQGLQIKILNLTGSTTSATNN